MKQHGERNGTGFGFEKQMREADFTAFQRWYEHRSLLGKVSRAACEATLRGPQPNAADAAVMPQAA